MNRPYNQSVFHSIGNCYKRYLAVATKSDRILSKPKNAIAYGPSVSEVRRDASRRISATVAT